MKLRATHSLFRLARGSAAPVQWSSQAASYRPEPSGTSEGRWLTRGVTGSHKDGQPDEAVSRNLSNVVVTGLFVVELVVLWDARYGTLVDRLAHGLADEIE